MSALGETDVSSVSTDEAVGSAAVPGIFDIQSRPLIITVADDLPALHSRMPPGITALAAHVGGDGDTIILSNAEGSEAAVQIAPTMCLALATFSVTGKRFLADVSERLRNLGQFRQLTPILLPQDADGLASLIASTLLEQLKECSVYAQRLAREQASLRATFEQTQNAFAELERYVYDMGAQPTQLSFENPPEPDQLLYDLGIVEIRQILPISSPRLSSLELHLSDSRKLGMLVELRTIEDDESHGRWSIQGADLKSGWLTLPLQRGILGAQRTLELIIRPHSFKRGLPGLSLGGPQPLRDYRAVVIGGNSQPNRSLAFRAWTGLAGVRPSGDHVTLSGPTEPSTTGAREYHVPSEIIHEIKQVTSNWNPTFSVVEPLATRRGIQCHPPPPHLITVAALDGIVTDELCVFSATAAVESPQSAPVEFGIAFSSLPDSDVVRRIEDSELGNSLSDYVFTGWQIARHGEPTLLHLQLLRPSGRIYFATRMANGESNWYSWSTFTGMRQTFLGFSDLEPE